MREGWARGLLRGMYHDLEPLSFRRPRKHKFCPTFPRYARTCAKKEIFTQAGENDFFVALR